ncbi:MAG: hypothetical protein K9M49_07820 [Candidatus Marinimicrobia bacterium]|nr:hypothetical protein [Candidatus Neomarinimicrobiota bacterium]MCF7850807.1 hypothetical protein [Candidatus Neomarinimicrobiota bacterium]MCF7905047.1 hypothetical protein [Candidatus Neomarinimicrobiota bacterium]
MLKLIHALFLCMLFVKFSILPVSLKAGYELMEAGWPSASGNVTVVGAPSLTRVMINPALLSVADNTGIQFNYFIPYQSLNIHAGSLRSTMQVKNIPLAASLNFLGDEFYQELQLTLGMALELEEKLSAGISFNYLQLGVKTLTTRRTISLSPSIMYRVSDDITFGSTMFHLIQVKKAFRVAQRFQTGLSYTTAKTELILGLEKEEALPPEFCFGLSLDLYPHLQVAGGFRDKSQKLSMGWKFSREPFDIYYFYVHHPILPASHGLGLEIAL